jgi:hypothetical protein
MSVVEWFHNSCVGLKDTRRQRALRSTATCEDCQHAKASKKDKDISAKRESSPRNPLRPHQNAQTDMGACRALWSICPIMIGSERV